MGNNWSENNTETDDKRKEHSGRHVKSAKGFIVFVRNLHPETQEESLYDFFMSFGDVKNVHLNLDRNTGFAKGYAFLEYESEEEAKRAVDKADGQEFLGNEIEVDFAFKKEPKHRHSKSKKH